MVKPPTCAACVLAKQGAGFVQLTLPVDYRSIKLLIQGEAPGRDEVDQDKAFVGRAGHWLRRNILNNAGLTDANVLVDNTLRCMPPKNAKGDWYPIGEAREQAEQHCRQYDKWRLCPQHIPLLLMGNKAMAQRLGKEYEKISDYHGHITIRDGRVVGCTYHPSACMKQPNLLPVVIREVANTLEAAQQPDKLLWRPTVLKYVGMTVHSTHPRVMDLEWDRSTGKLLVVGMAESSQVAYSTFDVSKGLEVMRTHVGPIIGHNLIEADLPRAGIRPKSWKPEHVFDTLIVSHLVHPHLAELGLFDLGSMVRHYAPTSDWKHDKADLLTYNGLDCAYNYALYEALKGDLDITGQWHLVEKQQRLAEMTRIMHEKGVKCDSDAIRRFDSIWKADRQRIAQRFPFNPNSPKQVCAWARANGIKLSNSRIDTIKKASGIHPILAALSDYKDEGKSISVWFNEAAAEAGYIYPQFNVTGTEVARFSCSGPNCQNIPPHLRHIIVPRDPSLELVSWDFSQIENRCIAWLAHDENMLADFNAGMDFHSLSASRIYNKRVEDVTYEERKEGKITIHASNYRETAHHLAGRLYGNHSRDSVARAKLLQCAYFNAYPAIQRWHEAVSKSLDAGQILLRNPFGRVRAVYAQDSHERGKRGCHFLGCSTAADIVNQKALDVWQETGLVPLLVVHDELCYELEKGETKLRTRIDEIVNSSNKELEGLVIPSKRKCGENYGF